MATKIYIKFPIWKTRSVGINHKMITDDLIIEILYTGADGKRLYPHSYTMQKAKALQYPLQVINPKVKLHIIPIADLGIETKEDKEKREYFENFSF